MIGDEGAQRLKPRPDGLVRPIASLRRGLAWLCLPALIGAAFSIYLVASAHRANQGIDGFPLDDPWIHLNYARNLAQHHSFSYFPGDKPTAGSTSPLYTLILALGFLFTSNEKVLSYSLGIVFHTAFLVTAVLWARRRLGDAVWGAAFALLLALDERIAILAVSGMETSLFLFLITLSFWALAEKRQKLLGIALGLALWVRPDALVLAGVVQLDSALAWMSERRDAVAPGARVGGGAGARNRASPPREVRKPRGSGLQWALPFAALVVLYMAFNLATGGVLVPNTFAAKHAYYINPATLFIENDVRGCFLAGGFWLLTPLALIAIGIEAVRLLKRQPSELRTEVGWSLALPLAYLLFLPFSHRYDRYLVPALPAVALLGLAGLRQAAAWAGKAPFAWRSAHGIGAGVVLLMATVGQLVILPAAARGYHEVCLYHAQRHERAGRWLKENTPRDAVIATHDVGAIAYYSERRVVDLVGLIQPDAIPLLHKPDYVDFLARFFAREKVTHLAVMQNWLEVVNVDPLWVADPNPEVLEVHRWDPARTHLVPEHVSAMNRAASRSLQAGDLAGALSLLQRSLQSDRENARTWILAGAAEEMSGDLGAGERSYRESLRLWPESPEPALALAHLLARRGDREEAHALADSLFARRPDYRGLAQLRTALEQR